MDVDESVGGIVSIRVGDLVVPLAEEEFLYMGGGMDHEVDPIECVWNGMVGLVVGVSEFDPVREYKRVRVMVIGHVGWTYSDYVYVVGR